MIGRHKSPISGIQRVVSVVAHHEIIILLEGVFVNFFSVNRNFPVFDLNILVMLVSLNHFSIIGNRGIVQYNGQPFRWNSQRAIIVTCPQQFW